MMTFEEFKNKKIMLEFNGPVGQPDPSGVSSPSLLPRVSMPANPTMGTQPGMSMQQLKTDPYSTFMRSLQSMNSNQIRQISTRLQRDLAWLMQKPN